MLLRLRREKPLGVCRQRLEREGIDTLVDARYSGLDALEHRRQRLGLLVDKGAPQRNSRGSLASKNVVGIRQAKSC